MACFLVNLRAVQPLEVIYLSAFPLDIHTYPAWIPHFALDHNIHSRTNKCINQKAAFCRQLHQIGSW